MDYETVSAATFGQSLGGLGINLLARDVRRLAAFLQGVFGVEVYRLSGDFAILRYYGQVFQLHADHTFAAHPLPGLLSEAGARGAGIEIRLYESDPDAAVARLSDYPDAVLLQAPADKPHGLRECVILCENGYAWVPSRRIST